MVRISTDEELDELAKKQFLRRMFIRDLCCLLFVYVTGFLAGQLTTITYFWICYWTNSTPGLVWLVVSILCVGIAMGFLSTRILTWLD